VTSITKVVPTQADKIPADSGFRDGNDVKKSQDKRGIPSISICANNAIKVNTAIINAKIPAIIKMKSHFLCKLIILLISSRLLTFFIVKHHLLAFPKTLKIQQISSHFL